MSGYHYDPQGDICPDPGFSYYQHAHETSVSVKQEAERRRRLQAEETKRRRLAELHERKHREKKASRSL